MATVHTVVAFPSVWSGSSIIDAVHLANIPEPVFHMKWLRRWGVPHAHRPPPPGSLFHCRYFYAQISWATDEKKNVYFLVVVPCFGRRQKIPNDLSLTLGRSGYGALEMELAGTGPPVGKSKYITDSGSGF
ncbi:hypothetical protein GWI33_001029 [Rhynchophorus ferrugineus]|uniref:Uncharacterized protein n=1 Tax=Rhynchophorus ferrugineus TaxID=354439 RepID=A0A834MLX2_RHYFE|nr:hypothetical protein GWI33_001029 [Rhynchophorus ferrugineus]